MPRIDERSQGRGNRHRIALSHGLEERDPITRDESRIRERLRRAQRSRPGDRAALATVRIKRCRDTGIDLVRQGSRLFATWARSLNVRRAAGN